MHEQPPVMAARSMDVFNAYLGYFVGSVESRLVSAAALERTRLRPVIFR